MLAPREGDYEHIQDIIHAKERIQANDDTGEFNKRYGWFLTTNATDNSMKLKDMI